MGASPPEPIERSPGLEAIESLLIPGERLESHAFQRRLFALTHRRIVVGATTGRLIAVHRGLISGFTVQDIRWQDLRDAQLQVGIFGSTLTVTADAGDDLAGGAGAPRVFSYTGLRKDQAQVVYRACQFQEQAWREKRRVRELEEMRAKSGGVHLGGGVGAMPAAGEDAGRSPQARLQRAKEMLEQGLLTDAEFEQVKARILGEL
jgi:Short C-terminal domain